MALAAAQYAHDKGIPFVPDVNDLWPEAMRMVVDIPVVSDILFYPLKRDAEKVYSLVSGIIGTSDEYRDRPLKNQKLDVPRKTVYVGNEIAEFDKGVSRYGPEILKKEGEFWVTYAGTIGTSYDIRTMVLAGKELMDRKLGQYQDQNTGKRTSEGRIGKTGPRPGVPERRGFSAMFLILRWPPGLQSRTFW